jgi:hypothetical protein
LPTGFRSTLEDENGKPSANPFVFQPHKPSERACKLLPRQRYHPGAFVMVEESPHSFGNILIKKVIAELAQSNINNRKVLNEELRRRGCQSCLPDNRDL